MRELLERNRIAVIAVSTLAILLAAVLALRGQSRSGQATEGEVMSLAKEISVAIASAGEQGIALSAGPLNDRTWDTLRGLNGRLPALDSLGGVVDMVHAGFNQGNFKGYAVILLGRGWNSRFLVAASDGVYICTGWWTGCERTDR